MVTVVAVIIVLIQAILASLHLVLYKTVVAIFSVSDTSALLWLRWIFVILAVSFVVASLLALKFYNPVVRWLYIVAAVWLGAMLYLILAAAFYWLGTIVDVYSGSGVSLAVFGKILLLIAMIVTVYGAVHARKIVVTQISINMPSATAWQGKRAVWVSDIHLGHVNGLSFLNKVVAKINNLQPDIIFVGGDLYDGTEYPVQSSVSLLRQLQAPLGTYFITGNHEEFGDNTKFLDAISQSGIIILNNEVREVNGVQIIGVDYNDTVKPDKFDDILGKLNINRTTPSILLKHAPTALDVMDKYNIDLLLAGHTHRAQMWPLNSITWLVYKGYDFGYKKYKDMIVYTSSGVGTWGPPLKVGNPAEIVLMNFH